jgi:hypothetical protein
LEELGCGWKKILADFEDTNSLNNDQAFEKVEMLFWKLLKDEYWSNLANVWNNIMWMDMVETIFWQNFQTYIYWILIKFLKRLKHYYKNCWELNLIHAFANAWNNILWMDVDETIF